MPPIKVRCNQCKLVLRGKKDGNKHQSDTGHVWKPGYQCTQCDAVFAKRGECKRHVAACEVRGHTAPLPLLPTVVATGQPSSATSSYLNWMAFQAQMKSLVPDVTAAIPPAVPNPPPSGPPIWQVVTCRRCREQFGNAYALQMRSCTHEDVAANLHASSDGAEHEPEQHQPKVQNEAAPQEMCYMCSTAFPDKDALDAACAVHHGSEEELQEHYQRESKLHPRCRAVCSATGPAAVQASASAYDVTVQAPNQSLNEDHSVSSRSASSEIHEKLEAKLATSASASESSNNEPTASLAVRYQVENESTFATTHANITHYVSPNPVRCNQCKLVCQNVGTPKAREPMYFCTVCMRIHVRTTGHYPPTADIPLASAAVVSAPPATSSTSAEVRCFKCDIAFPATKALQAHYSESIFHPTCCTCSLGFVSIVAFVECASFAGSDCSEVFSATSTRPITPATPKTQRAPSPTPSTAVSSNTHCSQTTLLQSLVDEQTNVVLPGPDPRRLASSHPAGDYTAHSWDASGTKKFVLSYHCRTCLNDPCIEPVVTICGHLFCRSCLLQEMMSRTGCCPVCGKTFFVKLEVQI
ncbi:hypothetical protein C8T65DRAFT_664638 [Cerioporus squamosus]|nr:hypothetical protein C8T65DRAFT_664638 [Cerioporus squamosus]